MLAGRSGTGWFVRRTRTLCAANVILFAFQCAQLPNLAPAAGPAMGARHAMGWGGSSGAKTGAGAAFSLPDLFLGVDLSRRNGSPGVDPGARAVAELLARLRSGHPRHDRAFTPLAGVGYQADCSDGALRLTLESPTPRAPRSHRASGEAGLFDDPSGPGTPWGHRTPGATGLFDDPSGPAAPRGPRPSGEAGLFDDPSGPAAPRGPRPSGATVPFDDPWRQAAPRPHSFEYRFERMESGSLVHYQRSPDEIAPPFEAPGAVWFERPGGILEVYENRGLGVEQSFLLTERPELAGDLRIVGRIATDLQATAAVAGPSGLLFVDPASGAAVMRYGAVTAIDAEGRRTACPVTCIGDALTIAVPEAWVAQAALPILVDPVIGPNVQQSSNPKDEGHPAFEHNSINNSNLVVYQLAFSATDRDIIAQLINADGTLNGSPVIITQLADDERFPKVAFSPSVNRYLVVWEHAGKDIRGRIMNADLTPFAAAFYIDNNVGGVSQHPDVVRRVTNDDWCVVWTDTGGPGAGSDLFGELIDTNGTILRDDIVLRDTTADLYRPDLAYNGTLDECFMAYESATNGDLFGFGFNGGMTVTTTPVATISAAANIQDFAGVAWNSTVNEYLVVYESDQATLGDDHVRGQRVEPNDANLVGASFLIAGAADDEQDPEIDYSSAANTYMVVWDWRTAAPSSDWDVMGQEVKADGTLLGSNFQISQSPSSTSNEFFPAVKYNSSNQEFMAVWHDGRNGTDFNIWGQRLSSGVPQIQQEPINNAIRLAGRGSVYGHSGEFHWPVHIATIAGVGFPFSFTAHYRSGNSSDGPLGFGWEHTYMRRVESTGTPGASDAIVYDGTGRKDTYVWSGSAYLTPNGFYNSLVYFPGSDSFEIHDRYCTGCKTFAKRVGNTYKLTRIKDRNNNQMTLAYDASDRLSTITDTRGKVVTFTYTAQNRIDYFTDWANRKFDFTYDASGDLTETITPIVAGWPSGKKTAYMYASGQASAWLNHNLLSITDPKAQVFLVNAYEAATDRVDTQRYGTAAQVYDLQYFAGRTKEVNRRGFATECEFNAQGNATKVTDPALFFWTHAYNVHMERTSAVFPRGNKIVWTFDIANPDRKAQGNLLQERRSDEALGAEADIVRSFTYEGTFQFVKTATNARGFTTTYVFDYEIGGPFQGNVVRVDFPVVNLGQPTPQTIQVQMAYNTKGQMTSSTDGEGFQDSYVYYAAPDPQEGFLEKTIVANGTLNLTTRYTYNVVGQATSVQDPRLNTTTMTVNDLDQVTRTTAPAPLGYTVDYTFDGNDNMSQIDTANVDENGVPYPNGTLTASFTYDTLDNVLTETREIDGATNAVTAYAYDLEENLETATLPELNQVKLVYNNRDLVSSTTRGFGSPDASTETMTYDGNRNVLEHVHGEGGNHKDSFTLDGFDRGTRETDGLGNYTERSFDANSNVTVMRRVASGGAIMTQVTNSLDEIDRRFREDRLFNNSGGVAVGDGIARTDFLFNRNSRLTKSTDDNGNARTNTYDPADRRTKTVDALGEAQGNKVEYVLDPNGNATTVTATEYNQFTATSEVITTTHVYDVANRRTQTTEGAGSLNLVTQFKWDSLDNNTVVIDAETRTTRKAFDGLQRLLSTKFDEGGLNNLVQQTWNKNSRLTSQKDGNNNTTGYQYTARDLVKQISYADTTTKTLTYDLDDNALTITDQNSSVITNTYDPADRMTQRAIARGAGVQGTTLELYQLDGANRMTRAENRDGVTTIAVSQFFYDTLSQMDKEVQQIGALAAKTITCTLDGVGNRLSCTYPAGRVITHVCDQVNRIMQVKQGADVLAGIQYAGRREARRGYLNGILKEVTYDQVRRATQIRHVNGAGQEKAKLQYAYTPTHNRKYEHRVHDGKGDVYRYDGIYQVTGVKFGVPSADINPTKAFADYLTWDNKHEWTIDPVGNRKTMDRDAVVEQYNHVGGTYQPDPMNEYYNVGGVAKTQDNNGNLTNDGTQTYVYDYRNELLKVTRISDGAVLGDYKYDAGGRRVERVAGTTTHRYYWMGWQLLEARNGADAVVESHVWGNWIDELLTSDLGTSGTRYFFLDNAIGSICQATTAAGLVCEEFKYRDIYGKVDVYSCVDSGASRTCTLVSGTVIGNRHLFQGREWDSEAGLYQFRARALSPGMGRFPQRDTIDDDPLGNRYRYVVNNPVGRVDPSGRQSTRWKVENKTGLEGGGGYGGGGGGLYGDFGQLFSWNFILPCGGSLGPAGSGSLFGGADIPVPSRGGFGRGGDLPPLIYGTKDKPCKPGDTGPAGGGGTDPDPGPGPDPKDPAGNSAQPPKDPPDVSGGGGPVPDEPVGGRGNLKRLSKQDIREMGGEKVVGQLKDRGQDLYRDDAGNLWTVEVGRTGGKPNYVGHESEFPAQGRK